MKLHRREELLRALAALASHDALGHSRRGHGCGTVLAGLILLVIFFLLLLIAGSAGGAPRPFVPRRPVGLPAYRIARCAVMYWGEMRYDVAFLSDGSYWACSGPHGGWSGTWSVDQSRCLLRISETTGAGYWMHYEFRIDPNTLSGVGAGGNVKGLSLRLETRK